MRNYVIAIVAGVILFILGFVGIWQSRQSEKEHAQESPRTEFMKSADKAAKMMSKTFEEGREYSVLFEVCASDGKLFTIEEHLPDVDFGSRDRKFYQEIVMNELMTSQKLNFYFLAGGSVELIQTVVLSPDYNDDGSGMGVWEYSDSNTDGTWDSCIYANC